MAGLARSGGDVIDMYAERTWLGELFLRGGEAGTRQVGLRQGVTRRVLVDEGQRSVSTSLPDGHDPDVGREFAQHLASDDGREDLEQMLDRCRSGWAELSEVARGAAGLVPEMSVSCSLQRCGVDTGDALATDVRLSWRVVTRLRDAERREVARRSASGASPDRLTVPLLVEAMTAAVGQAREPRGASVAGTGRRTVLMLPEAAGSFVHEVFGHLLEIDAAVGALPPWSAGERISAADVTVVSDPLHPESWARMSVDDEGTPCRTRTLVHRGVVVGMLADRRAATAHDGGAGGAARRAAHDRPIRTRQTHTALLPGPASLADLAAAEPGCVVVDGLVRGEVSPVTGRFACLFARSWSGLPDETSAGGAVWVRGTARAAADQVLGVGREVRFGEGRCGKGGDAVPVSFSSLAVLVRALDVTGTPEPEPR